MFVCLFSTFQINFLTPHTQDCDGVLEDNALKNSKLGIYSNLARAYRAQQQFDRCLNMQQEQVDTRIQMHGAHHVLVGDAYCSLAVTHNLLGNLETARDWYSKASEIYTETYGIYSPRLYDKLVVNFAVLQQNLSFYDTALSMLVAAHKIYCQSYGRLTRQAAEAAREAGKTLFLAQRYEEAVDWYREAWDIKQKIYAGQPNHPELTDMRFTMALLNFNIFPKEAQALKPVLEELKDCLAVRSPRCMNSAEYMQKMIDIVESVITQGAAAVAESLPNANGGLGDGEDG